MKDLLKLTRPIPLEDHNGSKTGFIKSGYSGNLYMTHGMVEQFLLGTLGPFSFEVLQAIRGNLPAANRNNKDYPGMADVIVGAICKLTVHVDNRKVIITEVGDCPNAYDADHDAQRLQQAASRGLVRCAMRLGLGLHLWCKDEPYILHDVLSRRNGSEGTADEVQTDSADGAQAGGVRDGSNG